MLIRATLCVAFAAVSVFQACINAQAAPAAGQTEAENFPKAKIDLGGDFTAVVKFETEGEGTLLSKCSPSGRWAPDSKALFIRDRRLVYDIGWLGKMTGGDPVNDGKLHTAVLAARAGAVRLWLDGKVVVESPQFSRPDAAGHILKIGTATPEFWGDFTKGRIALVRIWERALSDDEIGLIFKGDGTGPNSPDFAHTPAIKPPSGGVPAAALAESWRLPPVQIISHAAATPPVGVPGASPEKTPVTALEKTTLTGLGPIRIRVEQPSTNTVEGGSRVVKRSLRIAVANTSAEPLDVKLKYIFFGYDAAAEKQLKILNEGTPDVAAKPRSTQIFETPIVTATMVGPKFDPTLKRVASSGTKFAGYGVQAFIGEKLAAESYDPFWLKDSWGKVR